MFVTHLPIALGTCKKVAERQLKPANQANRFKLNLAVYSQPTRGLIIRLGVQL